MQASRASNATVLDTGDGTGDALAASKINFVPTTYHTNATVVGAWGGFPCSGAGASSVRTPLGRGKETHRAKEINFHFLDSTAGPEGKKMALCPSKGFAPPLNQSLWR